VFKNRAFLIKMVKDRQQPPPRQGPGYIPPQPDYIDLEDLIKQIETSAIKVIVVYFSASTLRGTILALVRARTNPF